MITELKYIYTKSYKEKSYRVYEFWNIYYVQVYSENRHTESRLYTKEQLDKYFQLT